MKSPLRKYVESQAASMAAAPRAAQWFTVADGTRHPLIEISSDSSDDELPVGGSCGALAPFDPAATQAGDASEDDEREEDLVVAGARNYKIIFFLKFNMYQHCQFSPLGVCQTRTRKTRTTCHSGFSATQVPRVPRPSRRSCVKQIQMVF